MNQYTAIFFLFFQVVSAVAAEVPDSPDLSKFPAVLHYTATLSSDLNISDKKKHKVEIRYFTKNSKKPGYAESFRNVHISDNKAGFTLGAGKKQKSNFSSLQEFFAHTPSAEMQITLDGTVLSPKVGIIPAGHSQKSIALLQKKGSGDNGKHWKGYNKISSVTSFQAVTLSSDVYTNPFNVTSNPFEVPVIGPKLSRPLINLSVSTISEFSDVVETNKLRHENLYDERGRRYGTIAPTKDDALAILSQNSYSGSLQTPAPSGGFEGMPRIDGVLPPDTEAAVGPNHIVQMVNSQMQIFDKSGNSLAGPGPINDLWNGFGGRCESDNDGDPIAMYDEQADRWVLTQFAVSAPPESVCFAVSTSPDPLGTYYLYQVVTQDFPDYFKLGVWPASNNNAYFMGTNSGQPNRYDVYAMDRENMLLGNAARPAQFFQNFQNLLIPADNDGELPPVADEPGYFYTIRDSQDGYFNPSPANDSIDIYSFNVDWNTPANSTFTLQAVTSADGLVDFNWTVCGFFVGNCLEQPTSAVLIDSNSWWPQQRFQYRNFGIYGSLVGVWGVNAVASPGKLTAPRWFEFRKYTSDLQWTLRQQGTYAPDSTHRFSPSISMDESQNIGLGYSVTSASVFPSMRYTVHDNDLDDLGVMEAEATMKAGGGSQTNSSGRWGDYASMDVDPSDSCTFWYTTEYIQADTNADWKTYIGSFKVPGCKKHNILLFNDYTTEHEINVCKVDDSTNYDLAISYDFNTPTTMSLAGCPAGATCGFSANPITYPATTTLQFSSLSAATTGAHSLTVTATDGGSKTDTESLTLNLFGSLSSSPTLSSPANDSFSGSRTPELTWLALNGAQSYTVEVDDDPAFGSIDFTTTVNGVTSVTSGTLATESCYYWRVAPANLCGSGPASPSFRFYTPGLQTLAPVASTDVPITIPTTADPVDHLSTLDITGVGVINDVNLLNLDITHSYVGDLEVVLISPQGTSVVLMSQADNANCGGNNNIDISLDDEGSSAIWPCNPTGNGGTYQPSNPLSAFDGENADGTWTLNVKDPFNLDGGSINGWSLEFESFVDTGNYCPPGFSVGGTISGLVGSGLVLQNNGGDNLAIASDGPFTFSTYLDDLDPYSVTVLTQPSSPAQTCTVTNGSGNISGANVTNVSVSCTTNPDITFTGTNLSQDVCVNPGPTAITPVTLTTTSIGGYNNAINLAFNPALPAGITGGFSSNNFIPASSPGTDSILNLTVDNTASAGTNTVTVVATGSGITAKTLDVSLNVIYPLSAPGISFPADGSTGIASNTSFSWTVVSGASSYDIDIATDPGFTNIVFSANVATNSYTPGSSLSDDSTYYWRVRANDSCGSSGYIVAAFETAAISTTSTFTNCSSPSLAIPDNTPAGVTDTLSISDSGTITDVNITLDVSHTQVGDLIFNIENNSTGTNVTVIDRPGFTGTGGGCNRDNINTTLDDSSATPVEGVCPNSNPTIGAGPFSPNNPLSAFNSETLSGNWILTASDNRNSNTGTVNQWCVVATASVPPVITPADYGDLAGSYGVAKHEGAGVVRLGSNWTADSSFGEDVDDTDDDGISASGNWQIGSSSASMNINSNSAGFVACWFDWNNDGSFSVDEKSIAQNIVAGGVNISVSIPGTSTFGLNGDNFLETRCRLYNSEPARATELPTGTAASGEVEDYRFGADQLTPVTLTYHKAISTTNNFQLNWSTATETAVAGFNILGNVNSKWVKLNSSVIPAKGMNAIDFFDYSFNKNIRNVDFYIIEEVRTDGKSLKYGPYQSNRNYGKLPVRDIIDWATIKSESENRKQQRQSLLVNSYDFIKINVSKTGIYRISYQDLLNMGIDWNGVAANEISLTFENNAVARKVSDEVFHSGSYIDFIGVNANTLYTDTNVYILRLNPSQVKASESISDTFIIDTNSYYMAQYLVDDDVKYSYASPYSSPWFNTSLLAFNSEVNWTQAVILPHLVDNGINGRFSFRSWGGTDWPQTTDHHIQVLLNNQVKADVYSDGTEMIHQTFPVSFADMNAMSSVVFRLPADTGVDYDLMQIDSFSLEYPSQIVAINDSLQFVPVLSNSSSVDTIFQNGFEQSEVNGFVVNGFTNNQIVSYAYGSDTLYEFSSSSIESSPEGYKVSLPYQESVKYFIASENQLISPQMELASNTSVNLSQNYDYLIISHPDFIDSLSALVAYHSNNGLSVLVVNVEDIYAAYSYYRKDASAIKNFIADAHDKSGIKAVLLVGSDSYDYKNNLNIGSISFIPTLYHATDDLITYAPVDPLFTDIDNDLIPDLAIGRLPVRTNQELQNNINKILSFESRSYNNSAVFASDRDTSFDLFSNNMINRLPQNWSVDKAYLNELDISGAKQVLSNSINNGTTLTSYFGHSGPGTWSFEHLFDNADINLLSNTGKPTIIYQFGCWNNYFVLPQYNTMAHNFISLNDKGAVAVLGSSTLTESTHESNLGNQLMLQFSVPGITLGDAIQNAKSNLATTNSGYSDVLLGWSLLGDPMMKFGN